MSPEREADRALQCERIQEILDRLCPLLRGDGSDIILVALSDEGELLLRVTGDRSHCPMARATLEAALSAAVYLRVPQVKRVRVER